MKTAKRGHRSRRVEGYVLRLTGPLERHEVEALHIEIRALAKRHRLVIGGISVRRGTSRTT